MRKILTAAALLLGTLALAQPFKGSPAQSLFDEVSELLETQYWGTRSVGWPALFARYQAQLDGACAAQREACAFDAAEPLLAQMLAELNDGHAFYLSAEAVRGLAQLNQGNQASATLRLGYTAVRFCDTPGGVCTTGPGAQAAERQLPDQFVQHVVPGSPAAQAGLRYGDRILGYDAVRYAEARDNAELGRMAAEMARLVQAGQPVTLRVRRGAEGQTLELRMSGAIIQQAELPQLELRPDGIAVLTIRTFFIRGIAQRVHQLLRGAMEQKARGLVINLRGTSGGFATESLAIIAAFLEPEPLRFVPRYNAAQNVIELAYREGRAVLSVNGQVAESLAVENPVRFTGPVAVLVDGGCASACEYVPLMLQRAGRASVYGLPTNGLANTNTQQIPLQNGAVASIPTLQTHWARTQTPLPDRATPDFTTLNFYFEHFTTGRDIPLEQAIRRLG